MSTTNDYRAFEPDAYLHEYYGDVGEENLALLRFLVHSFAGVPSGGTMLDLGSGPTVYAAIAASSCVAEIHMADYAEENLSQVGAWLRDEAGAYRWSDFTRAILTLEGVEPSSEAVARRESETRRRIARLLHCDVRALPPVSGGYSQYDLLVTNFCVEAAATDPDDWRSCMARVCSLLKPGGQIIISAVEGATSYSVGETSFHAVPLRVQDIYRMLSDTGFDKATVTTSAVSADRPSRHYQGLMFARAMKAETEPCLHERT